MTYEQNVEAILESNFVGFKEEIIDNACERICMLGTKEETIDRVLKIIDEENNLSKLVEETPFGCGLNDTLAKNIKNRVLALKGARND